MGRALIAAAAATAATAVALAVAPPIARADPDVAVAASCGSIVDPALVEVALRVELPDAAGPVSIDCPAGAGAAVVVTAANVRTSVALADVEPPDRARVVALAVADELRGPSAPATAVVTLEHAEPPPLDRPHRWAVAFRVDGLIASKASAALVAIGLSRRFGPLAIEAELGFLGGTGDSGRVLAIGGQADLALSAIRTRHTDVALAAGVIAVAAATSTPTGLDNSRFYAGRGELRVELDLGASGWRALAAAGAGRSLSTPDWFATLTLGAVRGL